jgi:predicted phosphodiesterase
MPDSRKIIRIAIVVIAVAALAATYLLASARGKGGTQQEENQVWWIASDPHLGNFPYQPLASLQVAIQDVDNLGIADHAAILGDILNNHDTYRDNFFQLMDNLKVENWYYILGNHDFPQHTSEIEVSRKENFLPMLYYGIDVLGIRFIFISTEGSGLPSEGGVMDDNQLAWLENELEIHSNQPVFMFSHQPWYQWNVWDNLTLTIEGERNVKVWFCGHLHQWVINENVKPYNFIEVCDSSLDWAEHYNGVFMFLQRKGDTVNITMKFRNHLNHEWISVPKVGGGTIDNLSFSVKVA